VRRIRLFVGHGRSHSGAKRGCKRVALPALLIVAGTAAAQPVVTLQPPVSPACVSSPFGWRRAIGPHSPAGLHNGIDLPAPAGALVHAAASGTIVAIKRQGLGGVSIRIAHGGGIETLYAHLGNLVPAVAEGRRGVVAGEPLGHVARTGVTYGTHVFFAVFAGGVAVDPLGFLTVSNCGGAAVR
jgi:murein DD-endopeptidase MepM/ murein hydrolase activator NlpD